MPPPNAMPREQDPLVGYVAHTLVCTSYGSWYSAGVTDALWQSGTVALLDGVTGAGTGPRYILHVAHVVGDEGETETTMHVLDREATPGSPPLFGLADRSMGDPQSRSEVLGALRRLNGLPEGGGPEGLWAVRTYRATRGGRTHGLTYLDWRTWQEATAQALGHPAHEVWRAGQLDWSLAPERIR